MGSVPFEGPNGYISGDSMIVPDSGSGIDVYNLDGSLRYHLATPAESNTVFFVGGRQLLWYQDPESED